MTSLVDQVRRDGLLTPERPVVVLLSGGRDSICLLDVAVRVTGPGAVQALHVNYGLREAADADEAHCVEVCRALDVPLEVRHAVRPVERSSSPTLGPAFPPPKGRRSSNASIASRKAGRHLGRASASAW